jgi:hypothetical protein
MRECARERAPVRGHRLGTCRMCSLHIEYFLYRTFREHVPAPSVLDAHTC